MRENVEKVMERDQKLSDLDDRLAFHSRIISIFHMILFAINHTCDRHLDTNISLI